MEIYFKLFIAINVLSLVLSGVIQEKAKTISSRIVGGEIYSDLKPAYQVSLHRYSNITRTSTEHICGGTILNKRWIVSSADCISKNVLSANDLLIGVGWEIFDREMLGVEEIILHPDYSGDNIHDISLIKTNSDIEFKKDVQPISLLSKEWIKDKDFVTASGWSKSNVSQMLDIPVFMNMKTLTNEECALLCGPSHWDDSIDKSILCAIPYGDQYDPSSGLRQDDSGNPLIKDGFLVGIAIWSSSNDKPCKGTPDQFTRISEYLTWIKNHVNVTIR